MRTRKAAYALALLITGVILTEAGSSFAGETGPPVVEQSEGPNMPRNLREQVAGSVVAPCANCSTPTLRIDDVVIPPGTTFDTGTNCVCIGYQSITISPNVTIEPGARVTFSAPKVVIQNGFKAKYGSVVNIEKWIEPPPPPG